MRLFGGLTSSCNFSDVYGNLAREHFWESCKSWTSGCRTPEDTHLSAGMVLGASALLLDHPKSITKQKYFQKIVFKI